MSLRELATKLGVHHSYAHRLAIRFNRGKRVPCSFLAAGFYFAFDRGDFTFLQSKIRVPRNHSLPNSRTK